MRKTRELIKKIRDTKGTFHAKMGSIRDRIGMDLTEAEDIKKRWQEYTEELYKIGLKDPDNHGGMVIHLELDTLECEVKWALGSITMNKANGELFNDAIKCCTKYVRKFGKLCSGHRNRKGQFSFQSQRRAMPKNVQTIVELCSFHTPVKLFSKSLKLGFSST